MSFLSSLWPSSTTTTKTTPPIESASFHYSIVSYDFHTYFKLDDPKQVEFAQQFRSKIESEFSHELSNEPTKMRIFKTHYKAIGPHPIGYGMFETDCKNAQHFLKVLNFYQLNHGDLSVLIHPRSDQGDLADHTKNALWLGEKLNLVTEVLK